MSEYQYYEFQAINHSLTRAEQKKIRALSSRAQVSAHSAHFIYSYSDLPADPKALMWDYFDAMLYITNWGTRQLLLRFPLEAIDTELLLKYTTEETIEAYQKNGKLLISIECQIIDYEDWVDGEGWLSSLAQLREDILQGDFRLLYIAWLRSGEDSEYYEAISHDTIEPPIPAGLGTLSQAHKDFIHLFDIDPHLVKAAAQHSTSLSDTSKIPPLPQVEKVLDEVLLKSRTRLLQAVKQNTLEETELNLARELRLVLHKAPAATSGQRTLNQLYHEAKNIAEKQAEINHKKKEVERIKALKKLAKRKSSTWREIETLCDTKKGSCYDKAVDLLCQLRDLAEYQGENIDARLKTLLKNRQKYRALLARLKEKGFSTE